MKLIEREDGFDVALGGRSLFRHRAAEPWIFIGSAEPTVCARGGHYRIDDYVVARIPLAHATVSRRADDIRILLSPSAGAVPALEIRLHGGERGATLFFSALAPGFNRLWLRAAAEPRERIWGGGEQFSYFDLRGRRFPLWTSEPGVGRDKSTQLTFEADRRNGGGGDYHTTYYPQPTYISSRRYALHVDTTAYAAFDFRHPNFHEIEIWEIPRRIELWAADRFVDLVGALSARFGRQPPLPAWALQGAIIGLKDGERSFRRLEAFRAAGTAISGLWCEDWVGIRETAFGRRLFWDWKWNPQRYPELPRRIEALRREGVRFLGYVNPYLCTDGTLYSQASSAGYLIRRADSDEPYLLDFGEFSCGMVDFTDARAARWFQTEVIGRNMLDFGLSGWMADFGEYLPADARLADGSGGMLQHNAWPAMWAKVNAQAVAQRGASEILFFMRSGFTGVQAHCPMLWAGDQSVDFTRHDGLPTVICAALSSGLLGNAYHHSDIGGYTSLFGNVRTAELIQRWSEMAAFTSLMRSHEGNRPGENLQIDQDPQVLAHFARMTRIHSHLAPYLAALSREAASAGLPVQRPLFLHFEEDAGAYETQTAYLYGADVLVAPVLEPGAARWRTYLPAGASWRHVWSGLDFPGGAEVEVAAPLGQPPVFYRKGSAHEALFAALARM